MSACATCGTFTGDHATWCDRHPAHPRYENRNRFRDANVGPPSWVYRTQQAEAARLSDEGDIAGLVALRESAR